MTRAEYMCRNRGFMPSQIGCPCHGEKTMASKLFFRIIGITLITSLSLALFPSSVFAAAPVIKQHHFKFFLDPALVSDMSFAKTNLVKYVDDMNFILSKNTVRRLVFNPDSDIILTPTQPQSDQAVPPLPVENFEIWAHAVPTEYSVSYGGYAGVNDNGAGVLAGLKWTRVYDPDRLTSVADVIDYWTQINNMLHELAHVFGAGYGEYYNLANIQDVTGVAPIQNININDPADLFWSDKSDFLTDPLLRNSALGDQVGESFSRSDLLALVRYSNLTAEILNQNYRNAAPVIDFSRINLKIVDINNLPINAAKVDIWSVEGVSPFGTQLMVETFSNMAGELSFSWDGSSANPHNAYDFLRLLKIYKEGYAASVRYISVYDADIARLVDGSDHLDVVVRLEKISSPSNDESVFTDVDLNNFARTAIEKIFKAGVTGGCSSTPLLYCPEQSVTRAQMAIFLERSMKGSGFSPQPARGNVFSDVPADSFGAAWIEQMAAEGITGGCGSGNFCPNAPVTRAQMAVFMLRIKYGPTYSPPDSAGPIFLDVPSDYWASAWIEQFRNQGITSGCGNGNYCPEMSVTRAQMAIFLTKAFDFQ